MYQVSGALSRIEPLVEATNIRSRMYNQSVRVVARVYKQFRVTQALGVNVTLNSFKLDVCCQYLLLYLVFKIDIIRFSEQEKPQLLIFPHSLCRRTYS